VAETITPGQRPPCALVPSAADLKFAPPLYATAFATLDSSAINGIRLKLHPSVEIVRSSHPIVTIWAMNSGALTLAPIEDWRGEDALVARPHLEVEVRLLLPGGAAFLHALAAGRPLGATTCRRIVA